MRSYERFNVSADDFGFSLDAFGAEVTEVSEELGSATHFFGQGDVEDVLFFAESLELGVVDFDYADVVGYVEVVALPVLSEVPLEVVALFGAQ